MTPLSGTLATLASLALLAQPARASGDTHTTLSDPEGDASPHRTDVGLQGAIMLGANIDVISITASGWTTPTPTSDPYNGVQIDPEDASLMRVDVVLQGLVNPPGPLGLAGLPWDPFRFGPNPVFGYIEFDTDRDRDTGGDLSSGASHRFLANVGRFAMRPEGSHAARAPKSGEQVDFNFWTAPQYERSGADFELVFCGCFEPSVHTKLIGDNNEVFESGEVWIVRGRFFQRTQGYQQASAAFGGSAFGLYDPLVDLRFEHDAGADRTIISLVYPLTMQGAAMLSGQPLQSSDLDVNNHTSVTEAIEDVIEGAQSGGLPSSTATLTERWAQKSIDDALRVDRWRITALLGTSYVNPQSSLYVWTDAAGECLRADFDATGQVAPPDIADWLAYVLATDGGPADCDGAVNGSVKLCNPGPGWSVYDINYDGIVSPADAALIAPSCSGDTNADLRVDFVDLNNVLSSFGQTGAPVFSPGDLNADGRVDFFDLNLTLSSFGSLCPDPHLD